MSACRIYALFILTTMLIAACGSDQEAQNKLAYESIISAHTSGVISRESPIRIRFADDVVEADALNAPLEQIPISFKPAISGVAVWSTRRTLEFRPADRLPPATEYEASLSVGDIMDETPGLDRFSFKFTTMKPTFEITFAGIGTPDNQNPINQEIRGELISADAEIGVDIEKVITADQDGDDLDIQWRHNNNGRRHTFVITGITRKTENSAVNVEWQGAEIGAEVNGTRNFSIPSINSFEVLSARSVQGATAYIEIRFSDPLQANQNLRGLIRVHAGDQYQRAVTGIRFTIQNNLIQVFNNSRWDNAVQVTINAGIRNVLGGRLSESSIHRLVFNEVKPQLRFAGNKAIVPSAGGQTIPIETVNLKAITVEAVRVYETNMPQFLQVNNLSGSREMRRVGRVIWKKTVSLDYTPDKQNRWIRYGLDISPLTAEHPQGMYRLTISFNRPHIVYRCPDDSAEEEQEYSADDELESWDDEGNGDSYWDYTGIDWTDYYNNRDNPCHPAFYRNMYGNNTSASRNILISDIGLIAKKGNHDEVFVAVTDLNTAAPLAGADVSALDFQQQPLAAGRTDADGMLRLQVAGTPYLIIAKHNNQAGYLKVDSRSVLSVSHFDIAGETVERGIKGFIYGERGVWRPGDPIYQTFVLYDTEHQLPENHPVLFELRNARGQRVNTVRRTSGVNGFYHVKYETSPEAPTGNWLSTVRVGGTVFEKVLRVATVMPNRLKIDLTFSGRTESLREGNIEGVVSAQWLHGATARNLPAKVEVELAPAATRFPGFESYTFDDPTRSFESDVTTVFDGRLDGQGLASFQTTFSAGQGAPGVLAARFTNRVFEESGAFSTDQMTMPYHPYDRYIGILTPEGDRARGMLLTDTTHVVHLASLDNEGQPTLNARVEVKLYKIQWRWWWEKGPESLADYAGTTSFRPIQTEIVQLADGRGTWPLKIDYPSWGRYLVTARDLDSGHQTGKVVYIDWPGWAGRGQKQNPGGATVLAFASDKNEYSVGEQATLTIPTAQEGRGLVSIETGTRILRTEWIEATGEAMQFSFETTPEMAPNVYAHVTFLQPHAQSLNDLPIRMYGVIPISVTDPETRLNPQIAAADVFQPASTARIQVSEAGESAMTYTVAVVDEGLLGLTRYDTPDPWNHFYKRESLGVKTWDYFDEVAGAYGGSFERLIAIGGGDELLRSGQNNPNRFPPVVRFLGPFELDAGATNTHDVDIPQYVGAVRVMVVAGHDGAFGRAEKSVFVRKPLMVQGTLPRVLGPEETVDLPVAVFALEDHVKVVDLSIDVEGPISIESAARQSVTFDETGDQIVSFRLKTAPGTGIANIALNAVSGGESATQNINIGIRLPSRSVSVAVDTLLTNGGTWTRRIALPGIAGTNTALLEISRIPPLNLGKRLNYLIQYPHGCVEQVTSTAFAQLKLDMILNLDQARQDQIETNIKAAIDRLHAFQTAQGGFTYWPGESSGHYWATNYVGHFLLDAQTKGYTLPAGMLTQWEKFQRNAAMSWTPQEGRTHLIQAYRLFTLAKAGAPDLGAMNRLRESAGLTTVARWRLASAYQLAGQPEAAEALAQNVYDVETKRELSNTFGSPLRDKAMILEALSLLEEVEAALPLVEDISQTMASERWCSTHESAYALIALAQYYNLVDTDDEMTFEVAWDQDDDITLTTSEKIVQRRLTVADARGGTLAVRNTGQGTIFPRLIMEGVPAPGQEQQANNGLTMQVVYKNADNEVIQPGMVEQGTDIIAEVTIKNTSITQDYDEIALAHLAPSGWEIRNDRLRAQDNSLESRFDYQDIRDDRIYTYFDLDRGESKTFQLLLNASYLGRYYLPMISAEAMYDASIYARVKGAWTRVVRPGAM